MYRNLKLSRRLSRTVTISNSRVENRIERSSDLTIDESFFPRFFFVKLNTKTRKEFP